MDFSDHQLLRQYLNEGNHQAFTELVRRYLGLVHAAALRLCGNATLAEEVSQIVMGRLAGLRTVPPPSLPLVVWMHRNTRSAATDLLRSENRRRRREAVSASLRGMPHTPFPWEEIAPVLDEVIGGLSGRDRELVLRRFFQGQSHAAIAAALGVSEDAARMGIKRALERMRGLLGKRGVTTTASALGLSLGLPSHAFAGPPAAGLAASVSSAALATALPASLPLFSILTAGLLAMTHKTILIAGVSLLLAGTGLILNQAASRLPVQAASQPPAAAFTSLRKVKVPTIAPAVASGISNSRLESSNPAGGTKAAKEKKARDLLISQLEDLRKSIAGLPDGPEKEKDRVMERVLAARLRKSGYPTEEEIVKFLGQSGRSPESLGWVFAKTDDLKYLREGLERDPENSLLRFLAAAMPAKVDDGAATLSNASLRWLQEHQPGLHAAMRTGDGNPLSISVIEELNKGDFIFLPEDSLRRQDRAFLRGTREFSQKEACDFNTLTPDYSIRSRLVSQAVLSTDSLSKAVAALALSQSSEVDASETGLTQEWMLYKSMNDADLQTLLGESRENLLSAVEAERRRMLDLTDFRTALFNGGDESVIRTFDQLRDKMGEKAALQRMSDEAAAK